MAIGALGGVGEHHGGQAKLTGLMAKPDGGRWRLSSVSLPWQMKAVPAGCKVVLGNLLGGVPAHGWRCWRVVLRPIGSCRCGAMACGSRGGQHAVDVNQSTVMGK
jgi:hypothetical protein